MFVVFDLDGTLADLSHRLHHIQSTPKNWDAFHRECVNDRSIDALVVVAETFTTCGGHFKVEIWTGRSDTVRAETESWLISRGLNVPVMMREAGDRRPDHEVKGEWLESRGVPDLIFEDRSRMVEFWRSKDIRVCQVAEGQF